MNNSRFDKKIKNLTKSREETIPSYIENELNNKIEKIDKSKKTFNRKKIIVLVNAIAAVFLLIAFFIFYPADKNNKKSISEIKTKIIIPGKNIKIIWVQKKDFKLRRN